MPPQKGKTETSDDRQIVAADGWAVATDGNQWILQRLRGQRWIGLMFVRSTKAILAQCMKEKGVLPHTAKLLLTAIRDQFDPQQPQGQITPQYACRCRPDNAARKSPMDVAALQFNFMFIHQLAIPPFDENGFVMRRPLLTGKF